MNRRTIAIRNAHPRLRFNRQAVARVIHTLDANFIKSPLQRGGAEHQGVSAVPLGELSLVFLTDPALAKIHGEFMDDPTTTDVITFEGDPASDLAGEICVSADMAAKYVGLPPPDKPGGPARRSSFAKASKDKQAPALQEKFSTELTLYIVHGWLHLAGYDDLQPAKKRRMRAAEKHAMALLRAAKAMPAFRLS